MANPSPTITFQVDLTLLSNENIGPITNQVSTGVLSPDRYQESPDNAVVENSNRVNTVSGYFPSYTVSPDFSVKHGDTIVEYGQKAIYLRNMYGIGYAPAERAILTVVSVE